MSKFGYFVFSVLCALLAWPLALGAVPLLGVAFGCLGLGAVGVASRQHLTPTHLGGNNFPKKLRCSPNTKGVGLISRCLPSRTNARARRSGARPALAIAGGDADDGGGSSEPDCSNCYNSFYPFNIFITPYKHITKPLSLLQKSWSGCCCFVHNSAGEGWA